MSTDKRERCPSCKGRGGQFAFHNLGIDYRTHTSGHAKCRTCNGTGGVTPEFMERRRSGMKEKEARIARGESLKEAAEKRGITSAQLSRIERGSEDGR